MHCYAGVSRSATIVIAYLMQEHGMSYSDAMQHVKKQRYFICPNDGFRRQLSQFQKELRKSGGSNGAKEEGRIIESAGKNR